MPRPTLRIDFDAERAVGPGKIKLLELIGKHGSIFAAGRQMDMSYRLAWLLVDSLNRSFRAPLVAPQHGGGASLTEFGHAIVQHYRTLQSAAEKVGAAYRSAVGTRRASNGGGRNHRDETPSVALSGSRQTSLRICEIQECRSADLAIFRTGFRCEIWSHTICNREFARKSTSPGNRRSLDLGGACRQKQRTER
jgi:molybdate transport system regulatory protein